MTEHFLKVWPEYFEALWDGRKTFELRKNDRDFKVGDTLVLEEWSPLSHYSGRHTMRTVSYILSGDEGVELGLQPGFTVLGLSAENWRKND